MKFLVTPEFSEKLGAIGNPARQYVLNAISQISALSAANFTRGNFGDKIRSLGDDIYSIQDNDIRIIASSVKSEGEDAFLLIDLIELNPAKSTPSVYSRRDPRKN